MTGDEEQTTYESIKENIKKLSEYAKELNCVIMVISSLNKGETMEGASTIRYAADHIWKINSTENPKIKELLIVKNRNGELLKQDMLLMGEYSKFMEVE